MLDIALGLHQSNIFTNKEYSMLTLGTRGIYRTVRRVQLTRASMRTMEHVTFRSIAPLETTMTAVRFHTHS